MACWAQLEFNEAFSPAIQDLIFFHDHIILVLTLILTYVGYILFATLANKSVDVNFTQHQIIEMIWTIVPVFILLYIGAPSLFILYRIDYDFWIEETSFLRIKVIGHQWYWSYSHFYQENKFFEDNRQSTFDAYMVPTNALNPGDTRLLEVDNRLQLPCEIILKFCITSADVLHSWTVPSLGIKIDACPGRLNQTMAFIEQPGVFYGQCSEICGANHRFIPICVEARIAEKFLRPPGFNEPL